MLFLECSVGPDKIERLFLECSVGPDPSIFFHHRPTTTH